MTGNQREHGKPDRHNLARLPSVEQTGAGLAAYRFGDAWLRRLLAYLQANRDVVVQFVRDEMPGITLVQPEGTYLAWLDCRQAGIDGNPVDFFLRAGVALSNGALFGRAGEGFVRLNFSCPRQTLLAALDRMKRALASEPSGLPGTPRSPKRFPHGARARMLFVGCATAVAGDAAA